MIQSSMTPHKFHLLSLALLSCLIVLSLIKTFFLLIVVIRHTILSYLSAYTWIKLFIQTEMKVI